MQYGPIAHIDLKIPPRPPGYAFLEVSLKNDDDFSFCCLFIFCWDTVLASFFFFPFKLCLYFSSKRLEMLKMLFVVVMAMTLEDIDCGLVTLFACLGFI